MTFEEALKQLNDNHYLIGQQYKGMLMDGFVIIPNIPSHLDMFIMQAYLTQNNTDNFDKFSDFIVYILMDVDSYRKQKIYLKRVTLNEVLLARSNNNNK